MITDIGHRPLARRKQTVASPGFIGLFTEVGVIHHPSDRGGMEVRQGLSPWVSQEHQGTGQGQVPRVGDPLTPLLLSPSHLVVGRVLLPHSS